MVYEIKKLIDYILNNNLNIDKSLFFTIVIGQISIYGILLTFYQFVASFQGNRKAAVTYLGTSLNEYFVKQTVSSFNKIVSKKWFGLLFVLEILYRPFITVYEHVFSRSTVSIMNSIWFVFVVVYFLLFILIFFQCTESISQIKFCSNVKTNGYLIRDINRNFLKKTIKERRSELAVELLQGDLRNLYGGIQIDDNPELQYGYNDLIYAIFAEYMEQKKSEILRIKKNDTVPKNQIPWIYNSDSEVRLLREILDGKYFTLDEDNLQYILNFHLKFIEQNLIRAELDGCSNVKFSKYEIAPMKREQKIFDACEWKDITLKIYQKISDEKKQDFIYILRKVIIQKQSFYEQYCDDSIKSLIEIEMDSIFEGKREQKDFIKIFSRILQEEYFNDFYSEILRDKIIDYGRFNARELISQLSEKNATYLFTYIFMYYSIYKFRFDWEYINVNLLQTLWKQCGDMHIYEKDVIEKMKNSNIGHRFNDEMYKKLMEYINIEYDGGLFDRIYTEDILDVFYVWVIKACVVNKNRELYYVYENKLNMDIQINIINELSKHEELLEYDSIHEWVKWMSYYTFRKQSSIPKKLDITLRNLLLTDMNPEMIAKNASNSYHEKEIGTYLLIKLDELSDTTPKEKQVKEVVKNAFILSGMNMNEYIDLLEKECNICNCKINYVQKEKIKAYLLSTF